MKKNIFLCILTIFFALLISCKSSETKKNNIEESEKSSSAEKNDKKNYVGWIDTSKKEIELTKGIVQVKVKPNLGSFNFCAINKNDKYIPVLATSNEYTSTSLQIKTGKKVYKLVSDSNVNYSLLKSDNSMTVIYEIPKVCEVKANFKFMQSSSENDYDTLKVTYTITNNGTKKEDFSLKAIYDTVLGEITQTHFYTVGNSPVRNEVVYRTMQNQKWVISKNNYASVQFLFDGGDTTSIEILALANNSTLVKNTWEPDMLSYRAFDTVLSYNNSSIGVIWPSEKLMPEQSAKIIHYISFAVDENEPCGENLVYGIPAKVNSEKTKKLAQKVSNIDMNSDSKGENIKDFTESNNQNDDEDESVKEVLSEEPEKKENSKVEFNVNSISRDKLTPQYVDRLLNRITELEKDSSAANREEILLLNAELDYILSVLRKQ